MLARAIHVMGHDDLRFLLRVIANELESRGDQDSALTIALDVSQSRLRKIKDFLDTL